uniref:Stabilin 1 n=1 Tax=Stegastes partitus TaxID=144197 RepID=A0A3B4ZPW1_9TELE
MLNTYFLTATYFTWMRLTEVVFLVFLSVRFSPVRLQTPPPGRCDFLQREEGHSICTSCAAVSSCPQGSISAGTTNCRYYLVQVGSRELQLQGCQHICVRSFMYPQCCPQHWGALCLRKPSWSGKTCNFHGVCVDGDVGNGSCICDDGFSGVSCQNCKNPNAYGEKCDKVCDCEQGVCNKGPDGDGQCLCQPPYTGRRCDRGESFILVTCCVDLTRCVCVPGVCSQSDCDPNAQCSSQGSRISCACKPGYVGDGRLCVPRNPCSSDNGGCPPNSTVCVFKGCECMAGMSPVGGSAEFGCQLVSACSADTCHSSATCRTEMDGRPRSEPCMCEVGQIGDGRRCYGNLMARLLELDRSGSQRENLTGAVALFGEHDPPTSFRQATDKQLVFILFICRFRKRMFAAAEPQRTVHRLRPARFSVFVQNCGSPPPLRGPGPITVFVPTNQAIDRARDGSILCFLCLQLTVDELNALPRIQTMANQMVSISGQILLGDKGVRLASTNIMAANGIIHMIDGLLFPPSILPILPHRCDVTESKITVGPCVHCSYLYETQCPDGSVEMDSHQVGCEYVQSPLHSALSKGCAKFCNATKQCCRGFFGPDCKPCIGGFQHPCYDKGTCFDGIHGNGSCSCRPGLTGVACHICSDPTKHGEHCDEECRCVHGVCDNRPGSRGACRRGSCLDGFSGDFCDKMATPCNSDGLLEHCHIHAYFQQNGCQCLCRDGYEGDGHSCSPVNPCSRTDRGGCDANAQCAPLRPGEATCVCAEGWTGDGKVCIEINNCAAATRGGCSANADCNHIGPGQSECVCKTGYMGNGIVCDLVNPCLKNNGGCHGLAKCELKEGGAHTCTCPDGYAGDGNICYGSLLEVQAHLGLPVGPASEQQQYSLNVMILGLDLVRFPSEKGNSDDSSHVCNLAVKSLTSRLKLTALVSLQDHSCCPGFYGHECFKCPGDVGSWCSNHGECQDGNHGNGECRCYEGFHGTACEDCEPGRYGVNCSSSEQHKHNFCLPCCIPPAGGVTRTCCTSRSPCRSTCCITGPQGSAAACLCVAGYEGNGTFCKQLDLCSRSNGGCSQHAICQSVSAGERTCSCKDGYTGDGVVCLEMDGCLVNNGGCHKSADCIRTGPNMVRRRCCFLKSDTSYLTSLNNGGCSKYARCEYMGQGQRNCTCRIGYIGDGINCRGSTSTVSHVTSDITRSAPGPATSRDATQSIGPELRRFLLLQGSVWINNSSRIVRSDFITTNGVIHHIDKLLTPFSLEDKPKLQAKTVTLLQDAGLLPVLQTSIHQPFTVFWPTDRALEALPDERQRWLSSPDHRDQLAATLMNVGQATQSASFRSMHGSTIKYRCDRSLVVRADSARVVERFLTFSEGLAFGIDQLLEPPGLGAFCDTVENKTTHCGSEPTEPVTEGSCVSGSLWRLPLRSFPKHQNLRKLCTHELCLFPSWVQKCCKNHYSRDCQVCPGGLEAPCGNHGTCDDGLHGSGSCLCSTGFRGTACELCSRGYYGANCTACSCGKQGRCDDGIEGSGQCVCRPGWDGERCQINIECRRCHLQADCVSGAGCRCKPGFQGNGTFCTPDLCSEYNGGCHQSANCNQTGLQVNCTCHGGYQGDGYSCEPINRCVEEQNGGCSDFASCKFTGPVRTRFPLSSFGVIITGSPVQVSLVSPGERVQVKLTWFHSSENTAGVFHLRSPEGKYKMNFSQAAAACQAEDATLASFKQLGDAQQLGMHLCVAGWLEGGKAGYPTRFPSAKCGDNHVGLVMYKEPVDQSSLYDTFCYRLRGMTAAHLLPSSPAAALWNQNHMNRTQSLFEAKSFLFLNETCRTKSLR